MTIDHIADKVRAGERVTASEALALYRHAPTPLLGRLADGVRERKHPERVVSYIIGEGKDGTSQLVLDAVEAACTVLVESGGPVLVDGFARPMATIDPSRRYGILDGVIGRPLIESRRLLDCSRVVLAAELVGIAQRALDLTVAYVGERRQFGVPVGSFQAVAHRCAAGSLR